MQTPVQLRGGTNFLLDMLERVIGGNFRGTFILGVVIAVVIGIGTYLIGVPYPLLLASIAFVMDYDLLSRDYWGRLGTQSPGRHFSPTLPGRTALERTGTPYFSSAEKPELPAL
jgi:hypothetical protein